MKSFKQFFLENIGGIFKNASEWESAAKARGLVVKSMTHPSGEMIKYQIAKDKEGNNRGHFDHETKSGHLKEEVELDEVTVANAEKAFDLKQNAEAHKRAMLKHRDNPGQDSHEKFLKSRTAFINAHKKLKALDLPKPELDQLRKGTNISESEELDDATTPKFKKR